LHSGHTRWASHAYLKTIAANLGTYVNSITFQLSKNSSVGIAISFVLHSQFGFLAQCKPEKCVVLANGHESMPAAVALSAAQMFPYPEQRHWIVITTIIASIFASAAWQQWACPSSSSRPRGGCTAFWIALIRGLTVGIKVRNTHVHRPERRCLQNGASTGEADRPCHRLRGAIPRGLGAASRGGKNEGAGNTAFDPAEYVDARLDAVCYLLAPEIGTVGWGSGFRNGRPQRRKLPPSLSPAKILQCLHRSRSCRMRVLAAGLLSKALEKSLFLSTKRRTVIFASRGARPASGRLHHTRLPRRDHPLVWFAQCGGATFDGRCPRRWAQPKRFWGALPPLEMGGPVAG
jgi:hypothetical protein